MKSVLHAYIESLEKEYHWMTEQKKWVESSDSHLLCFTNKYTTTLYKNEITKKELEGWCINTIAGVLVLSMLIGFSMMVAFSITLGVLYPQYKVIFFLSIIYFLRGMKDTLPLKVGNKKSVM
jgi:hypothetical protein